MRVRAAPGIGCAARARFSRWRPKNFMEAFMPRGELREGSDIELRFSDRDDEAEDLGYGGGGGGASYDDDDEEDGGWAVTKDASDDLWDSTEDEDGDDEDGEDGITAVEVIDVEEEEEGDLFGGSLGGR